MILPRATGAIQHAPRPQCDTAPARPYLAVVLKLTRQCNLRCRYCYAGGSGRMGEDVLARAISEVLGLVQHADLIFHGGEPLLAGRKLLDLAVECERQSLRPGRSVANHIQTNATLVDEDWIDFFVANDFEVGVSIDGPRELNDANRVYPDGSGTFDAIHAAVEAMVGRGLSVGALAVVAEQSIPRAKEIFEFFHHSPFVGVDFLPRTCSEQGGGASATCGAPSPEGLASFMIEVFDRWMTESSRRLTIRSLDDAMRTMMGLRPMSCGFQATRACGRQTVTIDCDGEVYACDDFIGAAGFSLGNILEQGLGELLSSHRYRTLLSRIAALPQECTVCKWLDNCDGGCTYRRFLRSPTMEEPDYYCQARKRVFEHIYAWLTGQG